MNRFCGCALAAAIIAAASSAHAAIVAAEFTPPTASQANGLTQLHAQTFIAEISGPLNRMGASFLVSGTPVEGVTMELRNVVDDRPGPIVLATSTLAAGSVTSAGFNDPELTFFDFSGSGISLVAGTQYAVVLGTSDPAYHWFARSDGYANGGAFAFDEQFGWLGYGGFPPSLDHVFSVRLIPEPGSLGLLGFAGLLLTRRTLRRR